MSLPASMRYSPKDLRAIASELPRTVTAAVALEEAADEIEHLNAVVRAALIAGKITVNDVRTAAEPVTRRSFVPPYTLAAEQPTPPPRSALGRLWQRWFPPPIRLSDIHFNVDVAMPPGAKTPRRESCGGGRL